jgi:hypothetical protein
MTGPSELSEPLRSAAFVLSSPLIAPAGPAPEPVPEGYSEGPLSEFNDGGVPLG